MAHVKEWDLLVKSEQLWQGRNSHKNNRLQHLQGEKAQSSSSSA